MTMLKFKQQDSDRTWYYVGAVDPVYAGDSGYILASNGQLAWVDVYGNGNVYGTSRDTGRIHLLDFINLPIAQAVAGDSEPNPPVNDTQAMNRICDALDILEWNASTIDHVAKIVTSTGRRFHQADEFENEVKLP